MWRRTKKTGTRTCRRSTDAHHQCWLQATEVYPVLLASENFEDGPHVFKSQTISVSPYWNCSHCGITSDLAIRDTIGLWMRSFDS